MKSLEQALSDLKEIIETKAIDYDLPELKGNTIRVSYILIRPSKLHGYIVLDTHTNKSVTVTFSKSASIAVAKRVIKNLPFNDVLIFDKILEKNYNDSRFYCHNISTTNDTTRKRALESRLQIAYDKIDHAKQCLDNIILNDIR